ncbi:MAG: haloacid dehalogenase [Piscirickettsiaceae bacterium CG_4_9_14_3_um_filter_43_564]|nr:HAD-IIB family hydrolase [Thiomicrospira sp.]OIP93918.1 MAG: haloacid dehalogenase [Thiomicrospira sp. CG2_30_44_34]PIQ06337.1 MAG: haloacid dehalogenase [Piscirickettsiaceae bacterium CG18_big_fil_WC_8_21_14_2_50_44_103]PIU39511.1 MAG: haloacid dehalogenase [Piscirickettsiaceae bacterium CG07_land_8_20_14_0_80_44_28]PIW57880.1 MAG: haloacid dehalogenase [Piscirickettsiaceae bacterium CG12_big_fil_rev_8_21_14_0_65_44_934]PIW78625.1 MAG: haloacid dehalogenase [Piscirickettsiaceae bacterium C
MPPHLLLCTDLDRTLIPNGEAIEPPNARENFKAFCKSADVSLVYVTGRHKDLIKEAIQHYQLPEPDYVISDVGSKLYQLKAQQWHEMPKWLAEMNQAWRDYDADDIHTLLTEIQTLKRQEASKQNTHKLSYYIPLDTDQENLFRQIQSILEHHHINANLIWSIDEAKAIGLLDILPANATKRHAIEHLQNQLGVTHTETLFAGDSGNDLAVLASPIPAVLVGNASPEIQQQACQLAQQSQTSNQLYLAHATPTDNGNYAAGILQGVWHYFPNFRPQLKSLGVHYDVNC